MNRFFVLFLLIFSLAAQAQREEDKYAEVSWPTPNIAADTINELQGIVLHHTAVPTVLRSLMTLTDKRRGVGAHCVIDTDGTRYILCPPTAVTSMPVCLVSMGESRAITSLSVSSFKVILCGHH